MAISVGDTIPDVTLRTMTADGPKPIQSSEALGSGRVVLFAVPGAFTPTCSDVHLPGFVVRADELQQKGVDRVACISVNDAFVMDAWGKSREVNDKVMMLADGSGEFTKAMGLDRDASANGMGLRSQRYAAIIDNGVITYLGVESAPGVNASSAETVLAQL